MEWINRNEKTPERDGKYLIFGSRGASIGHWVQRIGKFQDATSNDDEGMTGWSGVKFVVTHWMPLPQPPEE
ncbi:TPA: DUF551 domain-containing protein [Morganella morganii subsp. morganii]|nr:DUF551 domain-containing protein [Morganella morganii]HDT0624434.1 DUF551 domain-containing protein [Morganella morganii subsp. morganii]